MYVSEGIPYGFTSAAIITYLRGQGVALDDIGILVAMLFLPWSFKWAWAPLVDLFRFNQYGGRKLWIVVCSTMMVFTLSLIPFLDAMANFGLLLSLVVIHNVFASTQDVAIDSLAVSTLRPEERARGNGFMFAGQNAGIAMGGAGSIALFAFIGFEYTLAVMCVLLLANLLFVVVFVRDPDIDAPSSGDRIATVVAGFFKELKVGLFGSGSGPLVALIYAILPMGALALTYATLTTIQVDYGLDQGQISSVTATSTLFAALGSVAGGFVGDRFGISRTLFVTTLLTACPALTLAILISQSGLTSLAVSTLTSIVAVNGLVSGMMIGARAAVFMGVANPAVGATMFTLYMAMSNLVISYTNFWQGQVAERFDYSTLLFIDAALVVFPLCIIPFLTTRKSTPIPS